MGVKALMFFHLLEETVAIDYIIIYFIEKESPLLPGSGPREIINYEIISP
jgi:hypothetical protein